MRRLQNGLELIIPSLAVRRERLSRNFFTSVTDAVAICFLFQDHIIPDFEVLRL